MKSQNKTRIKALLIDVAVVFALWVIIHIIAPISLRDHTQYVFYHYLSLAIAIAAFLCKDLINGQSIGKRICKLKVVDDNGNGLSQTQLFLRNIFVFIAFIEVIFLFFSNKRTGDIALKSRVVHTEEVSPKATAKEIAIFSAYFLGTIVIYFVLVYLWWKIVVY